MSSISEEGLSPLKCGGCGAEGEHERESASGNIHRLGDIGHFTRSGGDAMTKSEQAQGLCVFEVDGKPCGMPENDFLHNRYWLVGRHRYTPPAETGRFVSTGITPVTTANESAETKAGPAPVPLCGVCHNPLHLHGKHTDPCPEPAAPVSQHGPGFYTESTEPSEVAPVSPEPPLHDKYSLSESGPTTGHWVCECGVDLGDAPIDEIDDVFAQHKRDAAPVSPPRKGFELLNDLLHKAGVEVAEISTPNNVAACNRMYALLNECVDIVSELATGEVAPVSPPLCAVCGKPESYWEHGGNVTGVNNHKFAPVSESYESGKNEVILLPKEGHIITGEKTNIYDQSQPVSASTEPPMSAADFWNKRREMGAFFAREVPKIIEFAEAYAKYAAAQSLSAPPANTHLINEAAAIMQMCDLESDYYLSEKRAKTIKNRMRNFLASLSAQIPHDIELISAKVHEQWMESKRAQGVRSRKSESGEELMVPYDRLSEAAKELDRGAVRAVLNAMEDKR